MLYTFILFAYIRVKLLFFCEVYLCVCLICESHVTEIMSGPNGLQKPAVQWNEYLWGDNGELVGCTDCPEAQNKYNSDGVLSIQSAIKSSLCYNLEDVVQLASVWVSNDLKDF